MTTKDYLPVSYTYNFSIGTNTHIVALYTAYSTEYGLEGKALEKRESPRIADVIKGLSLTRAQRKRLKSLARSRENGIVLPSGEFRSY